MKPGGGGLSPTQKSPPPPPLLDLISWLRESDRFAEPSGGFGGLPPVEFLG